MNDLEKQQLPFHAKAKLKAKQLAGSVPGGLGRGGAEMLYNKIMEALNTSCPYCGRLLALTNISLDHKQPILRMKVKRKLYTPEEQSTLNSAQNLHIICEKCNKIKREIPHDKFVRLLEFLSTDPILKDLVLKRLSTSGIAFSFARFKVKNRS